MISSRHKDIVDFLLKFEHSSIAFKLQLLNKVENQISDSRLYQAIGAIDYYSRNSDDKSKQLVIVLSSILYTYQKPHWKGLNQFLVVVLSRIGFAPSAVMVDKDYNQNSNTFSPLNSFINQLCTTVNHLKNEVLIKDKVYLLTDFQKEIWSTCARSKFIGISAPTSAGKSFVILLKCIDKIINTGGNIVYIVPTLSLINQVVNDFHNKLKEFHLSKYEILTNYSENKHENIVYVLTPERAISAYNEMDNPFGNVNSFIVDEIQNIERIENKDDERSKILFDSLVELSFSNNPDLIIFSGPRVSGLKNMGFDIFNQIRSEEISTFSSPVTNFTYSISKKEKKYLFKQYCQISENHSIIEIKNTDYLKIGGKQYDNKFLSYLNTFLTFLEPNSKNIIFSPTSGTARKMAIYLAEKSKITTHSAKILSLIKYISDTVHPNYDLCETLAKKVVYHHGKVPFHIRNVLEYGIKEKMIDNVVCTTTLMQGVNLPAQNVIMRNGYLSTKKIQGIMPELTNYEISNLRGRAGRLLKDFIGRTFVLDENAFEQESERQENLFNDENKNLKSGYSQIFDKNKSEITDAVFNNKSNEDQGDEIGNDSKFLITYIRFNLLKHGLDCLERLNSVGIDYDINDLTLIRNKLSQDLVVPIDVCLKNRYVDPLIMNDIFNNINSFDLPTSINDLNLASDLYKLVSCIKANYPNYYSKYFNRELPDYFFYTVVDWVKEKPLREILNGEYFNNSDNIDKKIIEIQKAICFDLTALLRPFYSIKNLDYKFISCIEMGAYKPLTLQLISLNIPREVSIILKNSIFQEIQYKENEVTENYVKQIIKENMSKIDFWNQIQLSHLN